LDGRQLGAGCRCIDPPRPEEAAANGANELLARLAVPSAPIALIERDPRWIMT
jgi:hypothetical protein